MHDIIDRATHAHAHAQPSRAVDSVGQAPETVCHWQAGSNAGNSSAVGELLAVILSSEIDGGATKQPSDEAVAAVTGEGCGEPGLPATQRTSLVSEIMQLSQDDFPQFFHSWGL